jgi:hypothetical protein
MLSCLRGNQTERESRGSDDISYPRVERTQRQVQLWLRNIPMEARGGQRRRPQVGPEASGRCGGADVAGIFASAVAAGATC